MQSSDDLQSTMYVGENKYSGNSIRLIVLCNGKVSEYNLSEMKKDRLFFGNSPQCDIYIENPLISDVQGKIKLESGKLFVGNMGGKAQMYMNHGKQYSLMMEKKYYIKSSGDMFVRIIDTKNNYNVAVMVFSNVSANAIWCQKDISSGKLTIGREDSNDIVIDSPNISRKHAVLSGNDKGYIIYDNNSVNGVYVNGERVFRSKAVFNGDIIQVAGAFIFLSDGKVLYQSGTAGVSLKLHNVNKIVGKGESKKKILNHVFCDIENNEFVAIIGGSGAGKTTVMNAMSGFDSEIKGKVYCNNIDLRKNFSMLKNMIGFVPQQDIIYENLKLKRMLEYTAQLKMPSDLTKQEQQERIQKVLQMVGLEEHADTYIRKLSGGQKKRASIAVELLADPGLFFLDEPTSGLDPDTEKSLMNTLARLSKNEGKTIIMVTHTVQSIELCDKIIFMGPGGKICYCGKPQDIYEYFGIDNLVDIYSELAVNVEKWNKKYLMIYRQEHTEKLDETHDISNREEINKIIKRKDKSTSSLKQLAVLTKRYFELVFNDRQRLFLLLIQPFIIALLLKVVAKNDVFKIYDSTQSIMFALACSGIWIGLFNTIQEVCKERNILKREYMGNLRLWTYIVSKYIVQAVVCLMQTIILTSLFLFLMKHAPRKEQVLATPQLEICLTIFLTIYASAALGLIVSSCVKNSDRAMALAPFVLIIQLLFSGVLFELKGAADKISYITVSRWAMECLGNITNLNKLDMKIAGMPHKHNDIYNRGVSHLVSTWWILILMIVVCGVISVIVLKNLKKDSR